MPPPWGRLEIEGYSRPKLGDALINIREIPVEAIGRVEPVVGPQREPPGQRYVETHPRPADQVVRDRPVDGVDPESGVRQEQERVTMIIERAPKLEPESWSEIIRPAREGLVIGLGPRHQDHVHVELGPDRKILAGPKL